MKKSWIFTLILNVFLLFSVFAVKFSDNLFMWYLLLIFSAILTGSIIYHAIKDGKK